jgi:hypothetical protein
MDGATTPLASTTMAGFEFLHLPSELRIAIYSHLLPMQCVPSDYKHLRHVSRQIREELDHEVRKNIVTYQNLVARDLESSPVIRGDVKLQWPPLAVLGRDASLLDTQTLRVTFPLPRKHTNPRILEGGLRCLLDTLIPHIRYLNIYFHNDHVFMDESNVTGDSVSSVWEEIDELSFSVTYYFEYRSQTRGWSSDGEGVRKVELHWGGPAAYLEKELGPRHETVRKQVSSRTFLVIRPHLCHCNGDVSCTGHTHEIEIGDSSRGFRKWALICAGILTSIIVLELMFAIWKTLQGLQRYISGT